MENKNCEGCSMQVIDAKIYLYMPNYANNNELMLLVNRIPKRSEMRFLYKNYHYYAVKDYYAMYFSWSGKGNDGGFYGRTFDITMFDGRKVKLLGPWSSRCSLVNEYFETHCIEVAITDRHDTFYNNGTFYAGAITVDLARAILEKQYPEFTIVKEIDRLGEIKYKIVHKEDLKDTRRTKFYNEFFSHIHQRYASGGIYYHK